MGNERKIRWCLVANRTEAVIYVNGPESRFEFVERLSHPEGRLKERDRVSDRAGRGFASSGDGSLRHALDRQGGRPEEDARRFAGQVAACLERAIQEGRYDELLIAADPRFLGLLRQELSERARRAVVLEIPRELVRGSDQDIRRQVMDWARSA